MILVLVFGIWLSILSFFVNHKAETSQAETLFEFYARDNAHHIEDTFKEYTDTLKAIGAFYDSSKLVERDEFLIFTKPILAKLKGLIGVGWAPALSGSERENFEQEIKNLGMSDLGIKEQNAEGGWVSRTKQKRYFPLLYVAPEKGNEDRIGFDLLSDPSRREAVERALKTKRMVLSEPILSGEDSAGEMRVILVMPYYGRTSPQEANKLKGILSAAINLQEFLGKVIQGWQGDSRLDFYVTDESGFFGSDSGLLFDAHGGRVVSMPPSSSLSKQNSRWMFGWDLLMAGRLWHLTFMTPEGWVKQQRTPWPWIILGLGSALSVIFSILLAILFVNEVQIERVVVERTKELQEQIRERKEAQMKYVTLVENMPGVIYRCRADKDRTMEFISPAVKDLSGFPYSDFIQNRARSYASIVHPEDAEAVNRVIEENLQRKKTFAIEYRVLHRDGEPRWIYEKGRGFYDAHGKVCYLEGVIFDITDRKAMQEQIAQSQKIEAVGKLAGGIAHDFNNQLMVIGGYSDLLLSGLAADDSRRNDVGEIKKAADKSSQLIRQLLAFGRRQVVSPKIFQPNDLINDLQKVMAPLFGAAVKIVLKLSPELKRIKMDPAQLEQVLMNLAMNAKDAMPQGGIFTLQTRNFELRPDDDEKILGGIPPGKYVLLTVSDNGAGMSEEAKQHLFEPFFTTKEKHKGSGLGLATCYGIVRSTGGWIFVHSEKKAGTVFSIYLPQTQDQNHEEVPGKADDFKPDVRGNESILLVEDEEAVRNVAADFLSRQGYHVVTAEDAKKALELIFDKKTANIQLLITDIIMPGISGHEMADKIKSSYPEMPVLFMSGYTDDVVVRHGVQTASINYLQKPFTPSALGVKVREILDQKGQKNG